MAAREFHGVIVNNWEHPLTFVDASVDGGGWQDPWSPSRRPGPGLINPHEQAEWRSERDGVMTGTSGWSLWGTRVDIIEGNGDFDDHFEFVRVNWNIPFYVNPFSGDHTLVTYGT